MYHELITPSLWKSRGLASALTFYTDMHINNHLQNAQWHSRQQAQTLEARLFFNKYNVILQNFYIKIKNKSIFNDARYYLMKFF